MHVCIELNIGNAGMETLQMQIGRDHAHWSILFLLQNSIFFKTASSVVKDCTCTCKVFKPHLCVWLSFQAQVFFRSNLPRPYLFVELLPSFSWPSFSLWQYFWPHLLQPSSHPGYEFHLFLEPRLQCKINRWALCIEMCTGRGAKQQSKGCPLSHNTVSEKPSPYHQNNNV